MLLLADHDGADSAGQPWAGRRFTPNAFSHDDGSIPAALAEALRRFRHGDGGQREVVDALRGARLLIPLVAHLGESGENEQGLTIDKSQELSIITVKGPDGRTVMPVFSSAAAMQAWNPTARPIPSDGVKVALAAASEETDLVVLDPTSETEFVIRRPALWAIAQAQPWTPSPDDPEVLREFQLVSEREIAVTGVRIAPGDADARLAGPELVVRVELMQGLTETELNAVLSRLASRWAASEIIATRVDSLTVQLVGSQT